MLGLENSKLASVQPFGFPELNLLASMKLPRPICAHFLVDCLVRLEFLELLPTHELATFFPLVRSLLLEVPSPILWSFDASSYSSGMLRVYVVE